MAFSLPEFLFLPHNSHTSHRLYLSPSPSHCRRCRQQPEWIALTKSNALLWHASSRCEWEWAPLMGNMHSTHTLTQMLLSSHTWPGIDAFQIENMPCPNTVLFWSKINSDKIWIFFVSFTVFRAKIIIAAFSPRIRPGFVCIALNSIEMAFTGCVVWKGCVICIYRRCCRWMTIASLVPHFFLFLEWDYFSI